METGIFDLEQESYAFIDAHFDSRFSEVPEKFLKIWHSFLSPNDFLMTDYHSRYEYRIFLYALNKYCKLNGKTVAEESVNALFRVFQLILCLPEVQRKTIGINTDFRIFDFDFYLKIANDSQFHS